MANAPLNQPLGNNNLLALVLQEVDVVSIVDTTEPTGTALTGSGNVSATFPTNAFGFQPPIVQGAYGLDISAVNAATTVEWVLEATDGTHFETVDSGSFAPGVGGCICRKWMSSLAAGTDSQGSMAAPITGLRVVVTLSGATTAATVKLVATGSP